MKCKQSPTEFELGSPSTRKSFRICIQKHTHAHTYRELHWRSKPFKVEKMSSKLAGLKSKPLSQSATDQLNHIPNNRYTILAVIPADNHKYFQFKLLVWVINLDTLFSLIFRSSWFVETRLHRGKNVKRKEKKKRMWVRFWSGAVILLVFYLIQSIPRWRKDIDLWD